MMFTQLGQAAEVLISRSAMCWVFPTVLIRSLCQLASFSLPAILHWQAGNHLAAGTNRRRGQIRGTERQVTVMAELKVPNSVRKSSYRGTCTICQLKHAKCSQYGVYKAWKHVDNRNGVLSPWQHGVHVMGPGSRDLFFRYPWPWKFLPRLPCPTFHHLQP